MAWVGRDLKDLIPNTLPWAWTFCFHHYAVTHHSIAFTTKLWTPCFQIIASKIIYDMSKQIMEKKSYKASYVSIFMQARMEETTDVWKFLKQPFSWLLCQNIKFYSGVTGRGWLLKVFPLECFKFLLFKRHDAPDLEGCYSSLFMLLSIWQF